jgi:tetratricopeptide (TPR) repeat protein
MADGRPEQAIQEFDKAIAINPQHALAVFKRANAYGRLGKMDLACAGYTEALSLQKEIAAMDPAERASAVPLGCELAQAHSNRATLLNLNRAGKPDEVIKDFTEAMRLDPGHADAYYGRGMAYLERGLLDLAIDDLGEAIRLAPDSSQAYSCRARARLAAGQYNEAVRDAQSAIQLDGRCGDCFRTLGLALLSLPNQQPEKAVHYLSESIRLDKSLTATVNPELAHAYFSQGVNLNKAGKQVEAESAFGEAERLDRKYVELVRVVKAQNNAAGNGSGKYEVVKQIAPSPKLPELYRQAISSLERRQFDKALDEFSNVVRMDPNRSDAWLGRGYAFLEMNHPDSAIRDIDAALRCEPDFAAAYCQRGRAHLKMNNFYRAISDATEAISLKPDFALAYFQRAVAYWKCNRLDRARADLDEAVRLNVPAGRDEGAKLNARADLEEAMKLDPKLEIQATSLYVEIHSGEASNHFGSRRWDDAIRNLEKAIALAPERARQFNPRLAHAYGERGFERANRREFPEAVSDLNRALDLDKNNAQTYRLCGLACFKMAKYSHDRRLTADEKDEWRDGIKYLKRAIWLTPELNYELKSPLDDAVRNLTKVSASVSVTQPTGL